MANSISRMAELFRARLAREETIALPGCYDGLSALVSEDDEFQQFIEKSYRERKYLG